MKEKKLSLKQKKMLIIAGIILAVLLVVILVIRAVTGKGSGNGEDVLYADSVGMVRVVIQNFLKKPVISTVFKADE